MRKLTRDGELLLMLIARTGGSYCPPDDISPDGLRLLDDLVKAKRLTVEPNDGAPPRFTLTAQGRADAS